MGKSKRAIYWAIMCILLAIITTACGLTIVHSSKVATLTLDQTVTYNAPTNIPVTFLANGGEFSGGGDTINETIKINTLSGTSIFPTNPTRTGYTFAGWEYSVDGTNYSDYASASDMPFTDHLYVRAKWEEMGYTVTISCPSWSEYVYYQVASSGATVPTNISNNAVTDINSEAWTNFPSTSFTINDVKRIFITIGTDTSGGLFRMTCSINNNTMGMIGVSGERYSENYVYYFDSGILTANTIYNITANAWQDSGGGAN